MVVGVLAAGLVIMFAAFQLARTEERANPFLRRLLYGYNAALTGVLLLAVLLVVNVFLNIWSKTPLDFTAGSSFTLSPQSQNILKSLDKPVQITQVHGFRNAFFLESEVKTLLDNCRDLSDKVEVKELSLHQDQQRARELAKKYPGIEPGCILLDVQMPGLNGPQLQQRLIDLGNRLPIIFVTGHGDIPTSVRAIKAGASDFLTKPVQKAKLLAAIEGALAHDTKRRAQDDELAVLRARVARLTPREREVFALVVRGKLNKQIAGELGTSERTIKAHRQKVMEKCEAQSLAELVRLAERLGQSVN